MRMTREESTRRHKARGGGGWRMVIQMLVRYADKVQLEILELK